LLNLAALLFVLLTMSANDTEPRYAPFPQIEEDLLRAIAAQPFSRVKAFRLWRGIKVINLAERSGVPADVIVRHEDGRRELSPDELNALATALNVPADLLKG
jgi:hypothetical protein